MSEKLNIVDNMEAAPDFFFVVKDTEEDFYWVLNLEDHPKSFLLDRSYQHFLSKNKKGDQDSMIIIQPTA